MGARQAKSPTQRLLGRRFFRAIYHEARHFANLAPRDGKAEILSAQEKGDFIDSLEGRWHNPSVDIG